MDVHVINAEEESDHQAKSDDADAEPSDSEINNAENSGFYDEDGISEPYLGMEFDSEEVAKAYYDDYAKHIGFTSKVGSRSRAKADGLNVYKEFVCEREGLKKRFNEGCDAMIRIELKGQNKWVVTKFVREHSHSTGSSSEAPSLHQGKHFSSVGRTMPESYQGVGLVPSGVMYLSMDGNHHISNQNSCAVLNIHAATASEVSHPVKNATSGNYTVRPPFQNRTLGKDAHNLLEYFMKMQAENPGFFYAIQLDEDNHMSNVFWADARSRTAYSHFGDAVHLDTTCRANQYRVPFAPFTGVNNHGQVVLFGCALLLDDSEASFLWLFKTFLTAMNDRQPVSLITDQDRAIQAAVSQVFPQTRHCINKWHVLREGQEKLAHVCLSHPNFQGELYNCINLTETIEEFELSWNSILDKYELRSNDWLQSLYNARAQWVPAYFRDSFFAAMSPNQGFGGSFFDGYVIQQMTLPLFFKQYEKALESWIEKEIEADFETICTTPVLRTPSPMEKQAANLYTRKIFLKFQEELVETFVYTANIIEGDDVNSTFKVAKFEDVDKAYTVAFNHAELRANCTCQMFEYSGILCRHILTVFTVTNVLTLPSYYILKRWTKNAKSSAGSDERTGELHSQESLTLRYSNLCREAIRYAEEGAVTVETYNAAVTGLKEGGKKVAAMKRSVAKATPPNNQVSGTTYNDKKTTTSSTSDLTPLLWPRHDEITRFNLNDSGGPVQSVADLNLPRTAPVYLHRDDGSSGNMAVLPCLKSMTWVMENKNSSHGSKVAVINLKLQDYGRSPSTEAEVKFQLSRVSLEPMLKSMAYISEQLSTPANKVAVINLKLQDADTTSGESEVKFQVSKDTLGAMLRSMAYIREQLSHAGDGQSEPLLKKHRK
ncbi:protein FAR1-RELATED SEQUENCE 3 [Vicia villosa]|uniref:protein FAR1-RELATED SEQUENCE 3 n=1 Tax=Vicia villosa TaxID=3911 RepID=UPI00273B9924|nr:protein FAR1-RELATED SEQUENCE 3 [Vicia villosa]XP_058755723.1 protein FAR1-RELATED SEQUENCE 3 [Vicia villosa]XP_058755724.1 protein FAR1-RELATED SEQUENCE 3 [Vicia villosa]XP_058755725.1 protein FAR1-RELATED SEQUENCE 3 [Vicia villosa]